jgi:hypothetical protein
MLFCAAVSSLEDEGLLIFVSMQTVHRAEGDSSIIMARFR